MGEKPSPLGEDFSMLAVWRIIENLAIPFMTLSTILFGLPNTASQFYGGEVAERARDLIREICKTKDVEIIKGHVSKDHVHIFVTVPPHISVSQLVQSLKGKPSRKLMIWARGYFVASSGNVTDEVIIKCTEEQGKEPPDGDFKIDD